MSEFSKNTAICCTQPPIIMENMENVRHGLDILLQDIATLPKTDEALKHVKQIRANLAKEFDRMEADRKAAKEMVMAPYKAAEDKYKEFISGPYKAADAVLKEWVDGYQDSLKMACYNTLQTYFDELCRVYGIDFLPFHRCGVTIDMAMARQKEPRKAMEKIEQYVLSVRQDMDTILKMDNAEEIMAEYRRFPVLSSAIITVDCRHQERERMRTYLEEQKRKRAEAEENRAALMEAMPEVAPQAEERYTVTFVASGTMSALKAMKAHAATLGVTFEEFNQEEETE